MAVPWTGKRTGPRRNTPTGCALWILRLFILPHMIAGVAIIGYALLALLWAFGGDDLTGQITRAWWTQGKKNTTYHIQYAFHHGLATRVDNCTVGKSFYDRLPGSIKGPDPGPRPTNAQSGVDCPVELRIFSFGPIIHASLLPPAGYSITSQLFGAIFLAVFWNGIVGVFVYQLWIEPIRSRRTQGLG